LKDHVPVELQPLAINLLGESLEEKKSLEESVNGILRKQMEWDANEGLKREKALRNTLARLREEEAKIGRNLVSGRAYETIRHSLAGDIYSGTAADVARQLSHNQETLGWLREPVPFDTPCPVEPALPLRVLHGLRRFDAETRSQLELEGPSELIPYDEFADLVTREHEARSALAECAGYDTVLAGSLAAMPTKDLGDLLHGINRLAAAIRDLRSTRYGWSLPATLEVISGHASVWRTILTKTQEILANTQGLVEDADRRPVDGIPDGHDLKRVESDARRLYRHLADGGGLGLGPFAPTVVRERRYLTTSVRLAGQKCSTADDFLAVANTVMVRLECDRAWNLWTDHHPRVEGPLVLQIAELKGLMEHLERILSLSALVTTCRAGLAAAGNRVEPDWADPEALGTVAASCQFAMAQKELRSIEYRIATAASQCAQSDAALTHHPIVADLRASIMDRDQGRYWSCLSEARSLARARSELRTFDQELAALLNVLPDLTQTMMAHPHSSEWEPCLPRLHEAWAWKQANQWLDEQHASDDTHANEVRIGQIGDEILTVLGRLAEVQAWSHCFETLNDEHKRHMMAWQQAMRRLGKGTGKHAAHHRRDAKTHLSACREAIPAWVMPLHRVWDTVQPIPNAFDVVIVDEASQCGFEGLPLFYLGRKLLVVGDDKQISPESVGIEQDSIRGLMAQYLSDFAFRDTFEIERSVFDHAKRLYPTKQVTLREHFRCMPEIISFSNQIAYSDTPLIPMRQFGGERLAPLERIFVEKGYRKGAGSRVVNEPEANAIVQKIVELCRDARYAGKTLGVVVLQGSTQADLIQDKLRRELGDAEFARRRILCGSPYSFQGDERDIIFLSMVAAPNERSGTLSKETDRQRFNVAASRAKDVMYLVHSIAAADLSPSCFRRQLIEFFDHQQPAFIGRTNFAELERLAFESNRSIVAAPPPFDSWFEVDVALEIRRRGFNVIPQHAVDGRFIDLIALGSQVQIAVECDGDHWHGPDQYEADLSRQRQLERCGWRFVRVRESSFYRDRALSLEPLWRLLAPPPADVPVQRSQAQALVEAASPVERQSQADVRSPAKVRSPAPELRAPAVTEGLDEPAQEPSRRKASSGHGQSTGTQSTDTQSTRTHSKASPVEEITRKQIREGILWVLEECPNHSCTLQSLPTRVLKHYGVRTRGKPYARFERRVSNAVRWLCDKKRVEIYRATNERVRLAEQATLW
jgi:very-short-patch-repair endonuclease